MTHHKIRPSQPLRTSPNATPRPSAAECDSRSLEDFGLPSLAVQLAAVPSDDDQFAVEITGDFIWAVMDALLSTDRLPELVDSFERDVALVPEYWRAGITGTLSDLLQFTLLESAGHAWRGAPLQETINAACYDGLLDGDDATRLWAWIADSLWSATTDGGISPELSYDPDPKASTVALVAAYYAVSGNRNPSRVMQEYSDRLSSYEDAALQTL